MKNLSTIGISIKNDLRGNLKEVRVTYQGDTPYVKISFELLEDIYYNHEPILGALSPLWFAGFYLAPIEKDENGIVFERLFWNKKI